MVGWIETLFPRLRGTAYQVTSPAGDVCNCIAWAAGATDAWWWPGEPEKTYWPPGAVRQETLDAFRAVFEGLGYVACDSEAPEAGHEKVALFATPQGVPTHAARQPPSGRWTSKLGRGEDIEHALRDLEGQVYGSVALVMKHVLAPSPP